MKPVEEIKVTLPRSGITVRGIRAGGGGNPVLCLHGWLDNCASFEPLITRLSGHDLVAVDLPGHGWSDPPPSPMCQHLDYAAGILELVQQLGWRRFDLVGHSLGGALSSLIAGIRPASVGHLVFIDAIGPLPADPEVGRASVSRYLNAYLGDDQAPLYRSREQAVKARVQLADILVDTAEKLLERDLRAVPGGYSWRSDPRLRYPFALTFTEEQVLAYLRAITAPVLLVRAERTALVEDFYPHRIATVPSLRQIVLPGGHHLHMENPEPVAAEIRAFLGELAVARR